MKQKLIVERHLYKSTISVEYFSTCLSVTDRSTIQKFSKDIKDMNNRINQ